MSFILFDILAVFSTAGYSLLLETVPIFAFFFFFKFLAALGLHSLQSMGFLNFQWTRTAFLLLSSGSVAPRGHLSSKIRDQIHVLCIGRWILSHWTIGKSPSLRSAISTFLVDLLPCWLSFPFLLQNVFALTTTVLVSLRLQLLALFFIYSIPASVRP